MVSSMDPVSLVETGKIVELVKTLISTPSVSGEEHRLVDWLESYFKYIGLVDVERLPVEEAGDTLVGWIRGTEDARARQIRRWRRQRSRSTRWSGGLA